MDHTVWLRFFPLPCVHIIFPVGDWCVQKKEVKTLTSRLKRINPAYSQPLGEMIDLDQLTNDFSEEEDIILQSPQPHIDTDSNEDVEDESEVDLRSEVEGDMPFAPPPSLHIETPASPLADPTLNDNIPPLN